MDYGFTQVDVAMFFVALFVLPTIVGIWWIRREA
jgi:hypothetical protein